MEPEKLEAEPRKQRKTRKDKGQKRASRGNVFEGAERMLEHMSHPNTRFYSGPPIFVSVRMKGMEPFEFGCSQHFVENGFHVFVYPSLRDRYRQTRREIAISEVIDIEVTAAYDFTRPSALPDTPARILPVPEIHPPGGGRPVIHSAKDDIIRRLEESAQKQGGPAKIDSIPDMNRVSVSLGDS